MLNLPVDDLKRFIETAFVKSGVPEEDAKICSEILNHLRPARDRISRNWPLTDVY